MACGIFNQELLDVSLLRPSIFEFVLLSYSVYWMSTKCGVRNPMGNMNAFALEDQDQDFQLGVPFSFTQGKGDGLQIRKSVARLEENKITMDQLSI